MEQKKRTGQLRRAGWKGVIRLLGAGIILGALLSTVGCRRSQEQGLSSLEQRRVVRSTGSRRDDITVEGRSAGFVSQGKLGLSCTPSEIKLVDLSGINVFTKDRVKELLAGLVAHLMSTPGQQAGTPMTLNLEYAVQLGEGDRLHLGVLSFLKGPPRTPPAIFEAGATRDFELPKGCPSLNAGPPSHECLSALESKILVPALEETLKKLVVLCRMENCDPEELAGFLDSQDPWTRARAAVAVGDCGNVALAPALVKLVREDNVSVAVPAIGALGRLRLGKYVKLLVDRAGAADEKIIRAVAVALADIGTWEARKYLREWGKYHPLREIRDLATELLSEPE